MALCHEREQENLHVGALLRHGCVLLGPCEGDRLCEDCCVVKLASSAL